MKTSSLLGWIGLTTLFVFIVQAWVFGMLTGERTVGYTLQGFAMFIVMGVIVLLVRNNLK